MEIKRSEKRNHNIIGHGFYKSSCDIMTLRYKNSGEKNETSFYTGFQFIACLSKKKRINGLLFLFLLLFELTIMYKNFLASVPQLLIFKWIVLEFKTYSSVSNSRSKIFTLFIFKTTSK